MTGEGETPQAWAIAHLDDVAEVILGQSPPGSSYNTDGDGAPFFQGKAEFGELRPTVAKWTTAPKKRAQADDVLISVRAPVGPTNLASVDCSIGRGLAALRPLCGIAPRYLLYALRESSERLAQRATGTTFPAVSGKQLRSHEIPVAPLPEQRRIVEAIEEQFSRLDAGVESLQRVKRNLARLRASVLQAAVEGRLVPQDPEDEPAGVLLERLIEERRVAWEREQCARFEARGKAPTSDSWKAKYREPAGTRGPAGGCPEEWECVTVEQVSVLVTDGDHRPPPRVDSGIPHLTAKNVRGGRLLLTDCTYVSVEGFEQTRARYEPRPGDVIVTCVGTVGETALVPEGLTFSADRNLAAIRLTASGPLPKYVELVLHAPRWQRLLQTASGSTAQPHLYLKDLRPLPIPLPPLEEQSRIVAEVERQFSILDAVEQAIEGGLKRAGGLRQAILREAFAGRLVQQDPSDEPAAALLERIRAERAKA